jgi:hypothetical protein
VSRHRALALAWIQFNAAVIGADLTAALPFVVMATFLDLLFVVVTVAQARAQENENRWTWGLIVLGAPFLGYLLWRLFGARDDGSPGSLLPRR